MTSSLLPTRPRMAHLWVVLTPHGAVLGGTVTVEPCQLDAVDLLGLARVTAGDAPLTDLRAELASAVDQLGWSRLPDTPVGSAPPLPAGSGVLAEGTGLASRNLRLLRVEQGRVLVWLDASERYHALDEGHLEIISQLGETARAPAQLRLTSPETATHLASALLAAELIDEVPLHAPC